MRRASSAPSLADMTWRELLRSYLEDSPHATQVLADFCREREIQIIRYSTLDQRLRYVLGLLPPEPAHRLACDFVEHILPETAHPDERSAISAKRQWLDGGIDDAGLAEARRALVSYHSRAILEFTGAWLQENMIYEALTQCLSTSPSPFVSPRISKLTAKIRAVRPNKGADGFALETRWQAEHLSAFLSRR